MQTQPTTTETSTQSAVIDIVETPAPCTDCGPETFSLDNFKDWSDHDILAAILVEMIMVRRNFTDLSEGMTQMSSGPIGKLMGNLFGP